MFWSFAYGLKAELKFSHSFKKSVLSNLYIQFFETNAFYAFKMKSEICSEMTLS